MFGTTAEGAEDFAARAEEIENQATAVFFADFATLREPTTSWSTVSRKEQGRKGSQSQNNRTASHENLLYLSSVLVQNAAPT